MKYRTRRIFKTQITEPIVYADVHIAFPLHKNIYNTVVYETVGTVPRIYESPRISCIIFIQNTSAFSKSNIYL